MTDRTAFSPSEQRRSTGTVRLVGAGPGDPDLLTVRAARIIESASIIVHDGLVGEDILAMAAPDCELISVAKRRARHTLPQEDICALLIEIANSGRDVVRLKGGDPFIFGRGGEEADACRAADIAVEVVPGISAASGCAAQTLIPLTHRDAASAVTFVAGQCKGLSDQNWAGLAGKGRTLIIYMGVATSAQITEKLIADGLSPDTPVAVIENGTLGHARAFSSILTDLAGLIDRKGVTSPALIVVGDVAHMGTAELAETGWALAAREMHKEDAS